MTPVSTRIGQGYDVHRLVEGRKLVLGGVEIPYARGLLGHSDADVALHAIMDAIIGALGAGDIGTHFPDSDLRFKGISSLVLLHEVSKMLEARRARLVNLDCTIVCQAPRLAQHIPTMRERIAKTLGCKPAQVNIKATTTEGLGFEGEGLGISASAVALIEEVRQHGR